MSVVLIRFSAPHIYFLADKTSEKDQLRAFSEKVGLMFGDSFLLSRGFGNWQEVFTYLKGKERVVIAIDEFPFLIEANPAIPSIFQKGWDEDLKGSGAFLILLGSSIGMMETEVLGYKSPLFGRRTGQLLVEPLNFWDAKKFGARWSAEEFMNVYATLGGTPAYLLQFDYSHDHWTNVKRAILTREAYLSAEPEFILRQELREPRNYFAILRALSMGKTKPGEIVNETGFDKSMIGKYLSILTDLRVVRREVPVTEKTPEKSKKGIYTIDDNFFRFWFNFIFPNRSFIEEDEIDYMLEKKVKPAMDMFTSQVYEEVCRTFVKKGRLKGLKFDKVGRWRSKDAEIDIVATNDDDNAILFGEVKWSRKTQIHHLLSLHPLFMTAERYLRSTHPLFQTSNEIQPVLTVYGAIVEALLRAFLCTPPPAVCFYSLFRLPALFVTTPTRCS